MAWNLNSSDSVGHEEFDDTSGQNFPQQDFTTVRKHYFSKLVPQFSSDNNK